MNGKRIILMMVCCVLLVTACDKRQPMNKKDEIVNKNDSINDTEGTTEMKHEAEKREMDGNKGIDIEFCQNGEPDREARYAESVLHRIGLTGDEEAGGAVCIVTLLDVCTDNCTEEIGCVVPITIRVEKVLLQNDAFALREGDEILTWDCSRWRKNKDGFTVLFQEGYIPIAQIGSQYIVMIAEETENAKKQALLPLDYCVTAYSIPYGNNDDLSEGEVYDLLGLPDDVRKCSEDLLKMFVRE